MRHIIKTTAYVFTLAVSLLTACKKEDIDRPQPPAPKPPAPEQYFKIRVKAVITIGDVEYDSIPATFTIQSWDKQGVMHQKDTALDAGTRELFLPKSHTRFTLKLSKWGLTDEKTLAYNEVNENTEYILGGSRAARMLKGEEMYSNHTGSLQLYSKQEYVYDGQGRISEVKYFTKDPNMANPPLQHTASDVFTYTSNRLKVVFVDVRNGQASPGFASYTYDAQNRIISHEYEYLTEHARYGNVYTSRENYSLIKIHMLNEQNNPTDAREELKFIGGNRVEMKWISSVATSTAQYEFDFGINPYVHVKLPGLHFDYASKNNVVKEKSATANGTMNTTATIQYSYDNEGYITEAIKKSKHPATGQEQVYSKTVYIY